MAIVRLVLACPSTGTASGLELLDSGERIAIAAASVSAAGPQRLDQPAAAGEPAAPGMVGVPLLMIGPGELGAAAGRSHLERPWACCSARRHHALKHDARVLPATAAAVQLPPSAWAGDLAPTNCPAGSLGCCKPCSGGEPHNALATGQWKSARGLDAIGPHHPQGLPSDARDRECHQHRSQPCSTWPAVRAG